MDEKREFWKGDVTPAHSLDKNGLLRSEASTVQNARAAESSERAGLFPVRSELLRRDKCAAVELGLAGNLSTSLDPRGRLEKLWVSARWRGVIFIRGNEKPRS